METTNTDPSLRDAIANEIKKDRATLGPVQASGYEELERILKLAYEQSARGKGRERHATGPLGFRPWTQQPILEIGRMIGPGYHAGQVQKKVQEAITMYGSKNIHGALQECLGAIVYAAAMYRLLEESKKEL